MAGRSGVSDAPLSRRNLVKGPSGLFVSPHSSDDSVGEVAFVGSAGCSFGLAFGGFAGEVAAGVVVGAGLDN